MWPFVFSFFHLASCFPGSFMLKHVSALSLFYGWIIFHYSGNAKEYSNYCTISLISHASKVMLKILQARFQQYMNRELPAVQAEFRKGRGSGDQIVNIIWSIKKAREFQKNISFCFIDYDKAFRLVNQNKLWKILEETGTPNHLIRLLRNLYAGQEATVRTGHEKRERSMSRLYIVTVVI